MPRQILDYMLGKLLEAESVRAKRLLLKKCLNIAQITLLLLSIVAIGFMSAAGAYNALASKSFLESAAAYRAGDDTTASRVRSLAVDINDKADHNQGVRPERSRCSSRNACMMPLLIIAENMIMFVSCR